MRRIVLLAAIQAGVILAWAGYHERVRASAPTFRIPLRPTDPYDVLRGRYFVLNPLDGSLNTRAADSPLAEAAVDAFVRREKYYFGEALVGFCPSGEVHRVCDLARLDGEARGDRLWARARVNVTNEATAWRDGKPVVEPGWTVTVDMDLDRFFIPDALVLPGKERDTGWELEVSHRPRLPLLPKRLWFKGAPLLTP